jgi:cytochrome c oxidase assembly protein subunit 15
VSSAVPPPEASVSPLRRRFGALTAAATLVLIFVGGLVTSTGSGLAVPDWPLSYGMLMPPMVGGIFYEHGHRMAATGVGTLTLVLAFWTWRRESRAWVRRLAWLALAAVIVQGLLGGLTVLFLLPAPISVAHACLAQTFFCLLLLLAYATSREWTAIEADRAADRAGVRPAAAVATAVIYAQLVLGAVMRHLGAGLAVPDFPLVFGGLLPPAWTAGVAIHLAHRAGAVVVLFAVLRLALRCRRATEPRLVRLAAWLTVLVLLQLTLGAATILTQKAVLPTTAHVALGAAILGGAWLLTLRAYRLLLPAARPLPERSPLPRGVATA